MTNNRLNKAARFLDRADHRIAGWMERHGQFLLRISLAIVFVWFGVLKPLHISPSEELIKRTVYWFSPDVFVPILGWWEVACARLHAPPRAARDTV